jgi:DNA-binding MarR family transcriptional regulator
MTIDSFSDDLARRVLDTLPLIHRTLHRNMRAANQGVEPNQFMLLGWLVQRPHSVSELAQRQHVSLPTMSRTVTALVERGLVERVPVPGDRRTVQVTLTVAGGDALRMIRETMIATLSAVTSKLSAHDRERLADGLDVLSVAFGPAPPGCPADHEPPV